MNRARDSHPAAWPATSPGRAHGFERAGLLGILAVVHQIVEEIGIVEVELEGENDAPLGSLH